MNDLHIREAQRVDLDTIVALENRIFSYNQLSRASLRHFIRTPTADLIVAEAAGALLGYALVCYRAGSHTARLYSICADSSGGRRGVGRELLKHAEMRARAHHIRKLQLEVKDDNDPAIRLYNSMNYREFGRYEDYYDDGRDALRFEKSLLSPVHAAATLAP